MSVTAKDAVVAALKLAGHMNVLGAVDENKDSRYFGAAPAYLTILSSEIAAAENRALPAPVSGLDDNLPVSDDSAARVLPFGLAMYFSLIDRDSELYNFFSQLYYEKLLPSVKTDEVPITDSYDVKNDDTIMGR